MISAPFSYSRHPYASNISPELKADTGFMFVSGASCRGFSMGYDWLSMINTGQDGFSKV